jgi:probable HAF family extracellular repeat protein
MANPNYAITVDRLDQGDATIVLWKWTGTAWQLVEEATNGGWDDAIPWGTGVYNGTLKAGGRFGFPDWIINTPFTNRSGIQLHAKLALSPDTLPMSYGSFGCIVADGTFLNDVAKVVGSSPIEFDVRGFNANVGLTLTASKAGVPQGDVISAQKGDQVTMTVHLTGDATGVSKDCHVFIKQAAGNIGQYIDWTHDPKVHFGTFVNAANPSQTISGYYVDLQPGATSCSFNVNVLQNTSTAVPLKIKAYLLDSPNKPGTHRWYSDYGSPLTLIANGGHPKETFDLTPSLDNLSINTSGGAQGFLKTYKATPGATYHVAFDPFSIPDSIKVSDATHVYINSGFITDDNGSGPLSVNFTVDPKAAGTVTIKVVGSASGTSWDLSVSRVSQPLIAANNAPALAGTSEPADNSDTGQLNNSVALLSKAFVTLDNPLGVQGTDDNSINDNGKIVGDFTDSKGVDHGFIYKHGSFTTLDDPHGVNGTVLQGINANDKIVGDYFDSNSVEHGFVYKHGAFKTLDDPLGTNGTVALGVSENGRVVGYYIDGSSNDHGFLYSHGQFKTIDDSRGVQTHANGINANGKIVGNYTDGSGVEHGFFYKNGVFTTLDDSLGINGTVALEINDNGKIVGYYLDSNNVKHGFLYAHGQFTTIDDPLGLGGTIATGINDSGKIVGIYYDAAGAHHGFHV